MKVLAAFVLWATAVACAQSVTLRTAAQEGSAPKFIDTSGPYKYDATDFFSIGPMFGQLGFYEAGAMVGIADFPDVTRVLQAFVARPAVVRGLAIPG